MIGLCFWLVGITLAKADPADPSVKRLIETVDGERVEVQLIGDEYGYYWKSVVDSRCFVEAKSHQGRFSRVNPESILSKARIRRRAQEQELASLRSTSEQGYPCAKKMLTGKQRIPALLVEFQDDRFSTPDVTATFNKLLNTKDYNEGENVGSVKDYFLAQSNGQLEIDFDIIGPIRMANDVAYYGKDDDDGHIDIHMPDLVSEAMVAADPNIDFSIYDWDKDGTVDHVLVIFAGLSQSSGGTSDNIWSHKGVTSAFRNGVRIIDYACAPELRKYYEEIRLASIGTICHELSHSFGLPDTYDQTTGNYGTRSWDLMGTGVHNNSGYTPAGYTAFDKMFCQWQQPIVLEEDAIIDNMQPMADGGNFYLIPNDTYPNEFYLLENRQLKGWDAKLPGHGMLIMHVDYDETLFHRNIVNLNKEGNDHERCGLFLADNDPTLSSMSEEWIEDYQGDLYPYEDNNMLTNTSVPSSTLFHPNIDGSYLMSKPVTNIVENTDGTMSFHFANDIAKQDIFCLTASSDTLRFLSDTDVKLKVTITNHSYQQYTRYVGAYVWIIENGEKILHEARAFKLLDLERGQQEVCEFTLTGLDDDTDYEVCLYYYKDSSTGTWTKIGEPYNLNMTDRNLFKLTVQDDEKITVLSDNTVKLEVTLHNESFMPYTRAVGAYIYKKVDGEWKIQQPRSFVSKVFDAYSDMKYDFYLTGLEKDVEYRLYLFYYQDGQTSNWTSIGESYSITIDDSIIPAKGDLNGDGQVGLGDIAEIINFMSGSSAIPKDLVDINGDGSADVGDIMALINIMAASQANAARTTTAKPNDYR